MQATLTSSNDLRLSVAKVCSILGRIVITLAYFFILFLGCDLLVWAVTCAWTHNFDSAPWRDGGWWAWRNGITSPTLQLLLTQGSLLCFLSTSELPLRYAKFKDLLLHLFYLPFVVLGLTGAVGISAFILSWVLQFCDWAIVSLGLGWLF